MTLPEVDLVIGTHARNRLPELIEQAKTGRLNCVAPLEEKAAFDNLGVGYTHERTRAFLKVQGRLPAVLFLLYCALCPGPATAAL